MTLDKRTKRYHEILAETMTVRASGRVTKVVGLVLEATGPASQLGSVCQVYSPDQKTTCLLYTSDAADDN